MIEALFLIIGIVIGYFLKSPIYIYNEKPLELKDDLQSIGFSYSKDTLDQYDDEIFTDEVKESKKSFRKALDLYYEDFEHESHESYLKNLDQYKEMVDKSPNKFLKCHFENALFNEQYELAEYIKQTAKKRNFNLK